MIRSPRLVGSALIAASLAACLGVAATTVGSATAAPPATVAAAGTGTGTAAAVGQDAWVDVTVATVWIHRGSPREIDLPALQRPVQLHAWLHSMTTVQRRALTPRVATQLLYGEQVVVLRTVDGLWSRVRIPDQTGGKFPAGIIGWVPRRQLSPTALSATAQSVTVTAKRAALQFKTATGWSAGPSLSYATSLPLLSTTGQWVVVVLPAGRTGRLPATAVSVRSAGSPVLPPTSSNAVQQAKRFLGLPYLWAGMSSYGFDCSGLVMTVYRQLGVVLARDAADEAAQGTAVSRSDLRAGDLVFFSDNGTRGGIFHVGMYIGHGQMLDSPNSGARVSTKRLWHFAMTKDYWGARRYLS